MDVIDHNVFGYNLKRAQVCEAQIATLLMKHHPKYSFVKFNNDYRWDIEFLCDGQPFNVEVKEDYRCFHNPSNNTANKGTGYAVIEFESRGKRSGIYRSEADLWVCVLHDETTKLSEVFFIDPLELKKLIKMKEYHDIYQMEDTDSHNRVFRFDYEYLHECEHFRRIALLDMYK